MDYPSFKTLHLDHLPSCLGEVHDTVLNIRLLIAFLFLSYHRTEQEMLQIIFHCAKVL